MPSLTVDVLLCVILLGGAYILFGRQGTSTTSSTSAGKKKKRSKASKSAKAQVPPSDNAARAANGADNGKFSKAAAKASSDRCSASASTQATRQAPAEKNHVRQPEEEEEFPPLSSSTSSKPVKGLPKQMPIAERLAKPRPKTAVDDMVEKDAELQGQKVYSRTMRIVKPQETKPMLLDEQGDDDWEQAPKREQTDNYAWQSVPIASKKSSTIRIANSSFSQPQSQTASRSIPGLTEQTKKQRQNARKAAELKAAKEEAEHERLQRLAAHKRALERERMEEQNIPKGRQPAPQVQRSRREDVGGGMRAAVHDGKLIWE